MSQELLHAVVSVKHAGGLRLRLRFDDGTEGEVDLRKVIKFRGLLAPLKDPAYVAQVRVEQGTVTWPNGADLDEVVLYCALRGMPVPTDEKGPRHRRANSARAARGTRKPTKRRARRTGP